MRSGRKTDLVLRQYGIESQDHDRAVQLYFSSSTGCSRILALAIVPQRAIDALGGMERFNCYDFSVTPEFWSVNAVYKEDMYLGRAERFLIDLMKAEISEPYLKSEKYRNARSLNFEKKSDLF